MQITSRFTMALHLLCCIDLFGGSTKVTSDFLAGSIGTNPVVVRRLLGQLKDAGLVTVARGTGGCAITRPLDQISFLDVYRAVGAVDDDLFHFHESPNPECPVGGNIQELLGGRLKGIQRAMELEMGKQTLQELHDDLAVILAAKD